MRGTLCGPSCTTWWISRSKRKRSGTSSTARFTDTSTLRSSGRARYLRKRAPRKLHSFSWRTTADSSLCPTALHWWPTTQNGCTQSLCSSGSSSAYGMALPTMLNSSSTPRSWAHNKWSRNSRCQRRTHLRPRTLPRTWDSRRTNRNSGKKKRQESQTNSYNSRLICKQRLRRHVWMLPT